MKQNLVIKLKDIETNKRKLMYIYNPKMENWFNWQGSKFLKWYSDYGMNPFKALAYCFKSMLIFAMFYFIFYNDWDKIDMYLNFQLLNLRLLYYHIPIRLL